MNFVIKLLFAAIWKDNIYNFILVIINYLIKIIFYKLIKIIINILKLAKIILDIII